MEFLSSRMPLPTERAASGRRFGPRTISAITRITISSSGPGAEMKPIEREASARQRTGVNSGRSAAWRSATVCAASEVMIEPSG